MAPSGEGIDVLRRMMRGYLAHPNFAGFLILGLGCEDNQIHALDRGPRTAARPADQHRHDPGDRRHEEDGRRGHRAADRHAAPRTRRTATVPACRLILGTNCGGSDAYSGLTANPALGNAVDRLVVQGGTGIVGETPEIYGAEHLLTRRAATEAVGRKLLQRIAWWRAYTPKNGASMDDNPSPGNKAGGVTTILEKSLGAVAKGGTTTLADVVEYAEPVTSKGFVFMDTPGYDPVRSPASWPAAPTWSASPPAAGQRSAARRCPSIKLATNTALYDRHERRHGHQLRHRRRRHRVDGERRGETSSARSWRSPPATTPRASRWTTAKRSSCPGILAPSCRQPRRPRSAFAQAARAPGVGEGPVAARAAFPVQARGDDDDLVDLGLLLHLEQPLDDGLRLAGHHPAVALPAAAELRRTGERSRTCSGRSGSRIPRRMFCMVSVHAASNSSDRLVVVAGEGEHRHRRVRLVALAGPA